MIVFINFYIYILYYYSIYLYIIIVFINFYLLFYYYWLLISLLFLHELKSLLNII